MLLGNDGNAEDVFETNDAFKLQQDVYATPQEAKNQKLKVQRFSSMSEFIEKVRIQKCFDTQRNIDQFILDFPVWCDDYERMFEQLRPLHTDKAKQLGLYPIVFKALDVRKWDDYIPVRIIGEVCFESFVVPSMQRSLPRFEVFYERLLKYKKPIYFMQVDIAIKDGVEKIYDKSKCKVLYCPKDKFDPQPKFDIKKFNIEAQQVEVKD
jgi:hypothetical protein